MDKAALRSLLASEGLSPTELSKKQKKNQAEAARDRAESKSQPGSRKQADPAEGLFEKSTQPFAKRMEQFRKWISRETGVPWKLTVGRTVWLNAGSAEKGFWVQPATKRRMRRYPQFSLMARAPWKSYGMDRAAVTMSTFSAVHAGFGHGNIHQQSGKPPSLAAMKGYTNKITDLRAAFHLPVDPAAPPAPPEAPTPAAVKKLVQQEGSWMDLEDDQSDYLSWATRRHGNVGDDEPGSQDIAHARTLAKKIKARFPGLTVEQDEVDEWTTLSVTF